MDNRFLAQQQPVVENGGMFTRQKIQQLSKQVMNIYGNGSNIEPPSVARCMIDTYRGMNKHFIPTGYELSSFARVFDKDRKGYITEEDLLETASRLFLVNSNNQGSQAKGLSAFR